MQPPVLLSYPVRVVKQSLVQAQVGDVAALPDVDVDHFVRLEARYLPADVHLGVDGRLEQTQRARDHAVHGLQVHGGCLAREAGQLQRGAHCLKRK